MSVKASAFKGSILLVLTRGDFTSSDMYVVKLARMFQKSRDFPFRLNRADKYSLERVANKNKKKNSNRTEKI